MKRKLLCAAVVLATAQTAQAGVINFDNLSLNNWDLIAADYGDHGAGGAGDSRVGVSYSGSSGATNHLLFWNNDYGDLNKVAFTPDNGTTARINFSADPGWLINSITFDLAGWPNADLPADTVRAQILGFTADFGSPTIEGDSNGGRHFQFGLATPGGSTAYIEWGNNWNIGIDNIEFTVIADPDYHGVPEPMGLALFGSALGLLGWQRRRVLNRF